MNNNKVILVVLDGLNYQVARQCMGYLQGLNESSKATLYKIRCELPSMSRPLYECILTGKTPVESGIVNNNIVRLSNFSSVFSIAKEAGLTTAAAAYHWVSELYNRAPYNAIRDRHTHDEALPIQHGCFYHTDHYPDEHLFLDAEYLRREFNPDFLLIHPMNIDDAGHQAGLDSAKYRNSARMADVYLSSLMPEWIAQGYQILVTADHGMNNDLSHGGDLDEERDVPLWIVGNGFAHTGELENGALIKQTELCGTVCRLLGLESEGKTVNQVLLDADFSKDIA